MDESNRSLQPTWVVVGSKAPGLNLVVAEQFGCMIRGIFNYKNMLNKSKAEIYQRGLAVEIYFGGTLCYSEAFL